MSVPTTLEEAVAALDSALDSDEQAALILSDEKDLIVYHHTLGRWMRNNWGFWSRGALYEEMKSLGFTHPDDMSQSIIREYWSRKTNRPSTIAGDVIKYAKYWEKNS